MRYVRYIQLCGFVMFAHNGTNMPKNYIYIYIHIYIYIYVLAYVRRFRLASLQLFVAYVIATH